MSITEDDTFGPFLKALTDEIQEFAAANAAVESASGDRPAALKAFMTASDDEKAVKFRESITRLQEAFKDYANESVQVTNYTPDEIKELETRRNQARTQARNSTNAVLGIAALVHKTDEVQAWLDSLENNPLKSRAKSSGTGSALPKVSVRITVTADTAPDKPQTFENFTQAAKFVGWDTADLQKETAGNAGLDHAELAKLAEAVEFEVPFQNGQGAYTVHVAPKERAKPGRKPAVKTA